MRLPWIIGKGKKVTITGIFSSGRSGKSAALPDVFSVHRGARRARPVPDLPGLAFNIVGHSVSPVGHHREYHEGVLGLLGPNGVLGLLIPNGVLGLLGPNGVLGLLIPNGMFDFCGPQD
jgi:hypothetical protein